MPIRPSHLWKELSPETRVTVAEAFWRDPDAADQQVEAIVMLARRLNFRTKFLQSMPIDRRAKHLARVTDLTDTIAGRALVGYHFAHERPLMAAFLDALGIQHEDGLIAAEDVAPPDEARLKEALEKVRSAFPAEAVNLYVQTLVALDPDTWTALDRLIQANG